MAEALVWCEPQERKNMSLVQGDIGRAIAWFGEVTGQQPELIMVHPSNEHIAMENSNGIRVQTLGGVLASEVWLSVEDNFVMPKLATDVVTESISGYFQAQPMEIPTEKEKTKMSTLNSTSPKVDNFRPRGRPKTYKKLSLPDDKIKQLHKEGLGAKAIASKLKREQGIPVSYKTIQRVLSGERVTA